MAERACSARQFADIHACAQDALGTIDASTVRTMTRTSEGSEAAHHATPDAAAELRRIELVQAERKGEALAHPEASVRPEALGVMSGMAAGAATGALAGPPGMVAGAVLGTALGAVAGVLWREREEEDRAVDERLDKDIGVIDGSLGEASRNQPSTRIGAFSAAAMGAGGGAGSADDSAQSDGGPMTSPHEE